jgi:hypothetical protein
MHLDEAAGDGLDNLGDLRTCVNAEHGPPTIPR